VLKKQPLGSEQLVGFVDLGIDQKLFDELARVLPPMIE
jgi:hypothetical protein